MLLDVVYQASVAIMTTAGKKRINTLRSLLLILLAMEWLLLRELVRAVFVV